MHPRAARPRSQRSNALGRARPRETTVGVDIGYATAAFEIPERRPDWQAVLTFPSAPSDRRSGFLLAVKPVYGQGMSVAAREASILADLLRRRARDGEGPVGLPQEYLAEAQPWIAGAWSMSTTRI
jgi:hypothetical protein